MKNISACIFRSNYIPGLNLCKLILLGFFCILTGIKSYAQNDFRPGYYITLQNDTVNGFIDYRGESRNSNSVLFRKDEFSESIKFDPTEIQAYRFVDGKFYISKKIAPDSGEKIVFLEFLVDGITNLYFYRDLNNYKYFLEDKKGNMLELSNDTKTEKVDGKGEIQTNTNKYIGLLKATFADCKEIQPQIENVSLGHKSLINITKQYHNYVCDYEDCIVYEKKLSPIKVQFAPVLKSGFSFLRIDKGIFSNYDFEPEIHPGIGILINVVIPGIGEKISFETELDLNKYNFHGEYQLQNGSITENYNAYFDLMSLQPTLSVKYTFLNGKVKPTVAIGGYSDIFVGNDQKVVTVKTHTDTVYTFESHETPLASLVMGGFLQLGCNYKLSNHTFFTNLRYCYSAKQQKGITTIIHSINLNVGIFLENKKRLKHGISKL
jgi:hypothetical protein